ncbi:hypothetical protein ACJ41O_001798 [Fusarium nematophilum]
MVSVNNNGTKQGLRRVPRSTAPSLIRQIINEDGGVIVQGFLTPEQVARMNADIDPEMAQLEAGSFHDDDLLKQFHGQQTKRLTRVVNYSKTFRDEIVGNDLSHALCEETFRADTGDYWLSATQVIQIGPGNAAQPLHRDLGNWGIFVDAGPKAPEACLNHLIALTEFTEENGATRVIPGSHLWEDFNDLGSVDMTVPVEMNAGDALVISGKVVHGGGANKTKDFQRRALSMTFNIGYLVPEEAYCLTVPLEEARKMPVRTQTLLGFRSIYPAGTPGLWQVDYKELADYLKL